LQFAKNKFTGVSSKSSSKVAAKLENDMYEEGKETSYSFDRSFSSNALLLDMRMKTSTYLSLLAK